MPETIDVVLAKHSRKPENLIPILQGVQKEFGYISPESVKENFPVLCVSLRIRSSGSLRFMLSFVSPSRGATPSGFVWGQRAMSGAAPRCSTRWKRWPAGQMRRYDA